MPYNINIALRTFCAGRVFGRQAGSQVAEEGVEGATWPQKPFAHL